MLTRLLRTKSNVAVMALLLVITAAFAPVLNAQSGWYSVRIQNDSWYAIYALHLSPSGNPYWGPDLLGRRTLMTGYVFTTAPMPTGQYDLKLVDEDGDVCIVPGVTVGTSTNWRITNEWLLRCQFGRRTS